MMRRKYCLLTAVTLLITLSWAGWASAHAELGSAEPAPGQALSSSPEQIALTFTEPLQLGSTFTLLGTNFVQIPLPVSRPETRADQLIAADVPPLEPDVYTVQWLAISSDGHPISGSYQFTVGGTTMLESVALAEGVSYNPSDAVAWVMVTLAIVLPLAAYYWQKNQKP